MRKSILLTQEQHIFPDMLHINCKVSANAPCTGSVSSPAAVFTKISESKLKRK